MITYEKLYFLKPLKTFKYKDMITYEKLYKDNNYLYFNYTIIT